MKLQENVSGHTTKKYTKSNKNLGLKMIYTIIKQCDEPWHTVRNILTNFMAIIICGGIIFDDKRC